MRRHRSKPMITGIALVLAEIAEDALGADVDFARAAVDEEAIEIGAGIAREAVEKELEQQRLLRVEFAGGGPGEPDVAGLLFVLKREVDDLNRSGGGWLRAGKCVLAFRFQSDGRGLHGIENLVDAREFLVRRLSPLGSETTAPMLARK